MQVYQPQGVQQFSTLPVFMTANYNQIQKPSTRRPRRRLALPRRKPRMQRKGAGLSRPRVVTKSAFASQKRKFLRRKTTSPRKSSFNTNTFCGFLDQQLNRPPTPSFSFVSVPNLLFDESWKNMMVENRIDQWGTNVATREDERRPIFDNSWENLLEQFQLDTFGSNQRN